MEENKTTDIRKKVLIIFSIVIAIFSIGLPLKTFQNDTFFNISIGNYILKNGIDMQEHFTWVKDITYYTYSHWAFDILISLVYKAGGFDGIYLFVILFTIFTNVSLFILTYKRYKSPFVSLIITLASTFFISTCYTARSQLLSFVCFLFEIYSIEQYIDTGKKKYAIYIFILSVIIANFHAATWPLMTVLMMPYLACGFLKIISRKGIYSACQKFFEKKAKKYPEDSDKYKEYMDVSNDYKSFIENIKPPVYSKIDVKDNYRFKGLLIICIILLLTGLLTPIGNVPYTYIINSMFGDSHLNGEHMSVDFIGEMTPTTPILNLGMIYFCILFFGLLIFLPININQEHGFLIVGLLLMALISVRYVYLLVFIGSFVLVDLLVKATTKLIPEDMIVIEKICTKPIAIILLLVLSVSYSTYVSVCRAHDPYIPENMYPVQAVDYIVRNLDYKNIRIFNSYDYGSYLMFHGIPVFIDSRLDVYCAEFSGSNVFKDFIEFSRGETTYYDLLEKYNFTHFLMEQGSGSVSYMKKSLQFKEIYSDDNFIIFEVLK